MRAFRTDGPGTPKLDRGAPEPVLPEGEALLRTVRAAVSRFDAGAMSRPFSASPITLGNEFVAVVEKVAPAKGTMRDRAAALVGKRVVGSPNAVCGECDLCRGGLSNHCAARTVLGVLNRDGCFADRFTLPAMNLHVVPDTVDDDRAVFALALASALHAVQQLRIEGKPYITVLGDGPVGLMCAQLMNRLNASVRVLGRSEAKLELAAKWGIKHRHEREAGRRADQDVVVDCTGVPEGLELALKLVRPRGKILLKGPVHPGALTPPAAPAELSLIWAKEVEVIGSRCGPIAEALGVLARGEVDVLSLISRRFKLDDATEALRTASRPETLKVLLDI
ncbi:MAG: alcohol dehydrogenase catalytic domain-containing protein [Planctomycetota bacterium]|nr:alcohol dehydrogenase catalytic domain-containing protein [Planctomycetota bacterium]